MGLSDPNFDVSATVYNDIRPPYLSEQVDFVIERTGLTPDDVVADIGAGTGKLSRMFTPNESGKTSCKQVICVEPSNQDGGMVDECHKNMAPYATAATVVTGEATATGLADKSVKLIVIGDAAHWFQPAEPVCKEFKRILKEDGKMAVFVRFPDPKAEIVQDLHKALKENCKTYRSTANKLVNDIDIVAKKSGEHLLEPELTTSSQSYLKATWTKEELLRYLQSRSSTNSWALEKENEALIYEKVIDPLFEKHARNTDKISIPHISLVTIGKVRKYEPLKSAERRDRDQKNAGEGIL